MASRVTQYLASIEYRPGSYARVTQAIVMVEYRDTTPAGAGSDLAGQQEQRTTESGQSITPTVTASQPTTATTPNTASATTGAAPAVTSTGQQTGTSAATAESGANAARSARISAGTANAAQGGGTVTQAGRGETVRRRTSRNSGGTASAGASLSPAQLAMAAQAGGRFSGAGFAGMGAVRAAGNSGIYVPGAQMQISASFLDLNYSRYVPPRLRYEVERYSWSAIGGPERATIRATGNIQSLQFLASMLRYGVELLDTQSRTVWWGYVAGIELHLSNRIIYASLDTMFNSVAIEYNALSSGSTGTGTRQLTSYATDANSVARYGTRQLIQQGTDISTSTAAEAKRDQVLAYTKLPRFDRQNIGRNQEFFAVLECRGWFQTLDWKYFSESDTANVSTTTQITDIVTAAGQFFTGTTINTASGISTNPYRDGNDRAGECIAQLLEVGSTSGRRLLASVGQDRALYVTGEPANDPTTNLRLDSGNILRGATGQLIPPHTCPVGKWVNDGDGLIGPIDAASYADPGAFFIERCEYSPRDARLELIPRGQPDIYDLVTIKPG